MTSASEAAPLESVSVPESHSDPASIRAMETEILTIRSDRDELLRRFASIPRSTQNASIQIAETSKAMQALRQARDGVMARAAALGEKLRLAEERAEELADRCELAKLERDGAIERLHQAHADLRDVREQLQAARDSKEIAAQGAGDISPDLLAKARALVAAAEAREGEAKDRQKATVANLVEQFGEERRRLKKEIEEAQTNAAVQISALQAQLSAHARDSLPAAEAERHRLEIANFRVELDTLREELRQAKLSHAESRVPAPAEPAPAAPLSPEPLLAPLPASEPDEQASLPPTVPDVAKSELAAMEWSLGEIEKDLAHLEAVDVLSSLFRDCSGRALSTGFMALHRLATACADVAVWMRKTPAKISAAIPLLREGRSLIERLVRTADPAKIEDLAGAKIYAVDNDCDNCECIVMALEKASLHTRYATKPDVAFSELAKGPVDLIVLDVDLGDTDGFDLHDLIRQIDHHRDTPVIFVSGLLSTADRLAGLSGPPASFVAKPYNLNELVLKVLCTIMTSRLNQIASN